MKFSVPYELHLINGKEYIWLKIDDFFALFFELAKYGKFNNNFVEYARKKNKKLNSYKKKRIREKKQKRLMLEVYNEMLKWNMTK